MVTGAVVFDCDAARICGVRMSCRQELLYLIVILPESVACSVSWRLELLCFDVTLLGSVACSVHYLAKHLREDFES